MKTTVLSLSLIAVSFAANAFDTEHFICSRGRAEIDIAVDYDVSDITETYLNRNTPTHSYWATITDNTIGYTIREGEIEIDRKTLEMWLYPRRGKQRTSTCHSLGRVPLGEPANP